jgi:uncharacterized protein (TIGR01777 family)
MLVARTILRIKLVKVALTGSHGLIGSAVLKDLSAKGVDVLKIVRSTSNEGGNELVWDPGSKNSSLKQLEGFHAVIHLAGDNLSSGRWTEQKKNLIRTSRVDRTRALCEALAGLNNSPPVLLCASAIGFYGDTGDNEVDETSPAGTGFLSDVCKEWEEATLSARTPLRRVVHLRTGIVLSPHGGALEKMLPPFLLGAGGVIGSGRQYMSWISIDDEVQAIWHCLTQTNISGAVNLVGPNAVRNLEFTAALGKVLRRPTFFPVPAFAARLAFGEMADALLLSSTRVKCKKLLETNFKFSCNDIESALHKVLKP